MSSGVISQDKSNQVRNDQREYLFRCADPYYETPLVLVAGSGSSVQDADGKEYLDFFSGIMTTSVGHCHPRVVKRVQEQVARMGHLSTLYLNEPQVQAAKRLAAIAPGALSKSFFTNSGTEAVETAIMLARMYTGREEVVALRYAYSGRSVLATNMTAQAPWRPLGSSIPWVKHARSPYCYRSVFHTDGGDCRVCVDQFIADLQEVIETTTNGRPAAFFAETIQGAGGFIVPPPGYFERAAELIHGYGGVLIIDEVQAGFGRTGKHWFGIQHWGVEPDIMVMAKGIANGFPVGATIAKAEIADAWQGKTISTFGGNPVCMAAMDETLQVMAEEDVPSRAAEMGQLLRKRLDALKDAHQWIGDVRGLGLMQGLELVVDRNSKTPNPEKAKSLLEATRELGLLIGIGGISGHVIRLAPNLLASEAEINEAMDRLEKACQVVST